MKERNITAQFLLTIVTLALVLLLPFMLFPYNRNTSPFESQRFVSSYLFSSIFLLAFYFVNRWHFIPKILASKKITLYTAIVASCLFIYLGVIYYIGITDTQIQEILKSPYAKTPYYTLQVRFFSPGPMSLYLLVVVISTGSLIIGQWFTAEEKQEAISRQQLQTELSLLKSQVNPHFLFNTLNSIYSLTLANSERASGAVLKLSRIMRYTLEESKNDVVTLSHEIEFINSYIDLQKVRLTDKVKVIFETKGDVEKVQVAPLLFIPFIENAFKYGVSTHKESVITIHITVNEKQVDFYCENDVFPYSLPEQQGTGTGLTNTKRKLELLYPNKYALDISEAHQTFTVRLTLNI